MLTAIGRAVKRAVGSKAPVSGEIGTSGTLSVTAAE